jgi:hypothetical protein
MDLKGILKANLEALGRLSYIEKEEYDKLSVDGNLNLTDFIYKSADLPYDVKIALANLDFSNKFVDLTTQVVLGKNDIEAKGKLENFLPYIMKDETPTQPTELAPTPANVSSGRNAKGQFTTGWKGGPGNPFSQRVQTLRAVILNAATKERMQDVVNALIQKAIKGDVAAAKLFLEYTVGSVRQEVAIAGGGVLHVVERIVRTREDRSAPDAG